jgi:hypothetical protein
LEGIGKMKNLKVGTKSLSRGQLANPYPNTSVKDRLKAKKTVDLRNNVKLVDLGNGYVQRVVMDRSKTY